MTQQALNNTNIALSLFHLCLASRAVAIRHCPSCKRSWRRQFSTTPSQDMTRLRRGMFEWLLNRGQIFQDPIENDTNYLTDYDRTGLRKEEDEIFSGQEGAKGSGATEKTAGAWAKDRNQNQRPRRPFPQNHHFISQSILSEQLREEIWRRVRLDGKSIRNVSVELGVEMRRVGAVVRLMEIQNQWRAEKKPLALPYAEAIHSMVPTTPLTTPPSPHETINDLPVHSMTLTQLFYPTSESRQFNRVDAGRVFSGAPRLPTKVDAGQGGKSIEAWRDTSVEIIGKPGHERPVLKAADARIPHPHLIAYEKDKLDRRLDSAERTERYYARLRDEEEQRAYEKEVHRKREERHTVRVDTGRYEFLIKDCQTTRIGTGLDGRGTASPGRRYGAPNQDRKRGVYKMPNKVEV